MLGMGSANERRRYYVTPPVIGRAHTQNDPWIYVNESHGAIKNWWYKHNKTKHNKACAYFMG